MTHAYAPAWGAQIGRDGVRFRIWAPAARQVALVLLGQDERTVAMVRNAAGWHEIADAPAQAGSLYLYEIDGDLRVPDPASRFQPDGPHGPSQVVDPSSFAWPDAAAALPPLSEMVFYELHVGAFTPEGTYAAAAERFEHLRDLGVTAIELMPLAETPGSRNWGYDGVLHYAPAHRYGTPDDLKRFVAAAHARGFALFLDVVYNHFGPEGNYLHRYAPQYFTRRYQTQWGDAIDYAAESNDAVRRYAIDNACYWLSEYRFDGLRVDAVHAIFGDPTAPFLRDLARESRAAAGRTVYLVVENDDNDAALLRDGFDAQWNDDAHHALHVLLTGERDRHYADFAGAPASLLGRALTSGFAYQGEPSRFRGGRARGRSTAGIGPAHFVNFLQNHDQVGNRAFGERITALAAPEAIRAALAVLLLAPSPPLLFMGEEWGASAPFLFFCDFEPALSQLVAAGRRGELGARIPDPALAQTFERSRLDWSELALPEHAAWLDFYRTLLHCRRREVAPRAARISNRDDAYRAIGQRGLCAWWTLDDGALLRFDGNLGAAPLAGFDEEPDGRVIFATHDARFPGGAAPGWAVRWSVA